MSPLVRKLGVALAILLLAGGGVAALLILRPPSSAPEPTSPTDPALLLRPRVDYSQTEVLAPSLARPLPTKPEVRTPIPLPDIQLEDAAFDRARGGKRIPVNVRLQLQNEVADALKWSRILIYNGRPIEDVLPVVIDWRQRIEKMLVEMKATPEVQKVVLEPYDRLAEEVRQHYAKSGTQAAAVPPPPLHPDPTGM